MDLIRYTDRATLFLRKIEERDTDAYHSLQGTIILLATSPEIDNQVKILMDSGTGSGPTPVYADSDWWIYYRVDRISASEQVLSIMSIWEASCPPHMRL